MFFPERNTPLLFTRKFTREDTTRAPAVAVSIRQLRAAEKRSSQQIYQREQPDVDERANPGAEHKPEYHGVYLDGIPQRVEMRTAVLVVVDSLNPDLVERKPQPLHLKQHVGLVLEPLAAELRKRRKIAYGKRPQPGLGVGYPDSAERRNTNRVQLFPNRLRGGTSSPVKSLAPSTALPDCSIFSAQR